VTDEERTPAEALADELIAIVQGAQVGGTRGDTAGLIMFGAYLYGFRRFSAIRRLAGDGDGAEAIILTRSLVSMLARAAYVDAPADYAERKLRWQRYQVTNLRDRIRQIQDLADGGFEIDNESDDLRADLEELERQGIAPLPNDHDLLQALNLTPFYARLYRPGSEHVHFSLQVALDELRGVEVVTLEHGDHELADEALRLAILTYGVLLQLSEKTVRHGVHGRVLERVQAVLGGSS
jgi:hypothetical protein